MLFNIAAKSANCFSGCPSTLWEFTPIVSQFRVDVALISA